MNAVVILHPWPRKTTTRRNKAVDPALWALMPSDVEGSEHREELQLAIRKVVVDPPGHCPPVGALGISVGKPRDDHCGQRAHAAASVAPIPDVAGIVSLARCAAQAMCVYRRRSPSERDRLNGSPGGQLLPARALAVPRKGAALLRSPSRDYREHSEYRAGRRSRCAGNPA